MRILTIDETWNAYGVPNNFGEFCKKIAPPILLKSSVNENVRNSLSIVNSLLEFSFFNYQFYDVAALKAIFTFEMAAKIRYREITGEDWKGTLNKLMEWLDKRHYFEVYNQHFLNSYRRFRNSLAHPTSHSFSGPNKRQWIMHTVNLINDMYEDPILRYDRKEIVFSIVEKLNEFKQQGFVVSIDSTPIICFEVALAFVNNKTNPMQMYFYLKPIFDISIAYRTEHKLSDSPVYFITANGFEILDDSIKLNTPNGEVLFSKINNEVAQETYANWIKLYREYNDQVMEDAHWNSQLSDLFEKHLREFYFQC
ncbi:MAG: hypothetical protein JST70_01980 [Bacteroidetes bacterium]|nr:hypothetical protein [Bacteroidota bacterium]